MSKKYMPALMGSLLLLSALPLTGIKAVLALAPSFPDLGDVVGPEGPLFQGQEAALSLDGTEEDYSWSVTGDASITEEGVLTVGDTDGWILVTATSDEDASYKSQALYEVHTPSAVELQDLGRVRDAPHFVAVTFEDASQGVEDRRSDGLRYIADPQTDQLLIRVCVRICIHLFRNGAEQITARKLLIIIIYLKHMYTPSCTVIF